MDKPLVTFKHVFTTENPGHIEDYYELDKKPLGEGSYGQVVKGVDRKSKQWRAIKAINRAKISDESRFEEEVAIQQQLHHPNIVKLYEVFKDAKKVYLVMELCTGGELFDRIIEKTEQNQGEMAFDERGAKTYMQQILGAIHYLHSNQYVHRDIKPENFLLQSKSDDAEIKVIDFGLAKYNPPRDGEEKHLMKTKAGTPYYVSPQVLAGRYNEKCDIWSCGVIAYILLCGYPPFYGDSDEEILRRVKKGNFEFPSPDWDHMSASAKDLIKQMLIFDEKTRPSAEAMLTHQWFTDLSKGAGGKINPELGKTLKKFHGQSKMKKVVLTLIAEQLQDKEVEELRRTFAALDNNKDGMLTLKEIKDGMAKHNIKVPEDLEDVLRNLDTDGSGSIDYTEFIAATITHKQYMKDEVLWSAFRIFDRDGNGMISKEELAMMLKEDPKDIKFAPQMIGEVDMNGDGEISFDEFRKMMESNI